MKADSSLSAAPGDPVAYAPSGAFFKVVWVFLCKDTAGLWDDFFNMSVITLHYYPVKFILTQ